MHTPIWKPVPGYEGLYEVSNTGLVRSMDRCITRKDGRQVQRKGRTLNPVKIGAGANESIALCKGGRPQSFRIDRLVALAFIGPCPKRHCLVRAKLLHSAPLAEQLRYVPLSQKHHYISPRGKHVLTPAVVARIKSQLACGIRHAALAAEHGVTVGTISAINTGRLWPHVQPEAV